MQQALALAPDAPEIWNNLAVAYERLGRDNEARALVHRIHAEHPDYFFGAITMSSIAIDRGAFDEALDYLRPLTGHRRYHISEFESLCTAYIQLGLAKKDWALAEEWLNNWRLIDADSEEFKFWQARVKIGCFMRWR